MRRAGRAIAKRLKVSRLLARVREVVTDVGANSSFRRQIDSLGVTVHEHAGVARFVDRHTIETESGLRHQAEKFIVCTGGMSRRLSVPGFELTNAHSDAWNLTSVPLSMLVIGAGATGVQVASIFNAFGSRIELFQTGPRILPSEDQDVSAAVAAAFQESGIVVHENVGTIESFEKTPTGVRVTWGPSESYRQLHGSGVGLTESKARETHDVVTAVVRFDSTTRTIIDGRKVGFCKLIADRKTYRILGCHVVGERAEEIIQLAAIAIAARMRVDDLAHIPLSFPTYAGILARAAGIAARELNLKVSLKAHQVENSWH
jgi:pyruvate/2-oxoglutarate dehydrogenase complex dihydrolipoamide dehydrogenase (E3) component